MQAELTDMTCRVSQMRANETAIITAINAADGLKTELAAHGVAVGAEIRFIKAAPLGDPLQLRVNGGNLCIRKRDAALICVQLLRERGGAGA